ncbi:hypothetical protein DRE_04080 [Drechslerella stenobrocha 248]|uniref:Piwi domain-containing protein n=1 Tax=Drechslerella stenobrocha 248 TaxID=1043628 RepID=W7I350_9PEZI|nr:hypothetical protein DRE_04080 [Drechslerella stenobrocha 248]
MSLRGSFVFRGDRNRGGHQGRGGYRGGGGGGGGYRGGGGGGSYRGGRGGRRGEELELYNPQNGPTEPDQNVTKIEDELVASLKDVSLEVQTGNFPPRRGFGTVGEQTNVRANFFPMSLTAGTVFYRYEVKMDPDEKRKTSRRRVIDLFIEEVLKKYTSAEIVTDGGGMIFTIEPLPLDKMNLIGQGAKVKLWWKDDDPPAPNDGSREFKILIRAATSMTAAQLTEEFVMGQSRHRELGQDQDIEIPSELIQIFNIVFNAEPEANPNIGGVGKNKFFHLPGHNGGVSKDLGGGLDAVQGYYKSVRPSFGRVLCNVNAVTSPFYGEMSLFEVIHKVTGRHPSDQPLGEYEKQRLSSFLKRVKVTLKHLKGRPAIVGNVANYNANEYTFYCEALGLRRDVSVTEYFEAKYNFRLRYPKLQLLKCGESMIPMEVCSIAPGQAFRGRISDTQTTNMIQFACRNPTANAKLITTAGLRTLGLENQQESMPYKFGFKIDPQMVVVPARILPPPAIRYRQSTTNVERNRGQWNLIRQQFSQGATINRLLVVGFERSRMPFYTKANLRQVVAQFKNNCRELGMNIACTGETITLDASQNVQYLLREVFADYSAPNKRPDLMLLVLPDELKNIYNDIKVLGDLKTGITTVVFLFSKVSKDLDGGSRNKQYFANLLMKVNIRMGGLNHSLNPESLATLLSPEGPTMLVGMDVTHPSPLSAQGSPSIASMVASCDSDFMNYPCSLRIQEKGEMIQGTTEMLMERLSQYRRLNRNARNARPPAIIFYRDGVSEGEFGRVLSHEFPKIVHACNQWDTGYRPRITFIVVGKRHHTRFYPTDATKADENKNCLPGTVVDRGVTAVYDWDFYLQAHKGLQGTARPAHYYVLRDENGFTADTLQCLTMNLCHLFARCTKAVSICPPAKLADLACDRARIYLASIMDTSGTESSALERKPEHVWERAKQMWGSGVHNDIKETMFYL